MDSCDDKGNLMRKLVFVKILLPVSNRKLPFSIPKLFPKYDFMFMHKNILETWRDGKKVYICFKI